MDTLYNDCIVKIISNNNDYNWYSPHQGASDSQSIGTGLFLTSDGYILTCCHVIQDSNLIEINIPSKGKEKYKANIISASLDYDLAVIKVDLNDCKFLKLGDSDAILQGDIVNAAGYPLGHDNLKVSQGVISGFQAHLIQTDAPINSGNSGGPLVKINSNNEYEVIGINSQKISSDMADNIGYSIPINYFKLLESSMMTKDFNIVYRPRLLCKFSITSEKMIEYLGSKKDLGYQIYKISKSSCLYKGGIRVLDLILSFDNYDIDRFGEVKLPKSKEKINIIDLLFKYPIGKTVKVTYFSKTLKVEKSCEILLENPQFKIKYKLVNFEDKKIDFEIISGLVICDMAENHLTKDQIPEYLTNKAKTEIFKYKEDMNKLNGKLYIVNILAGSHLYSDSDLSPGTFIESVSSGFDNKFIKVNSLLKFRKIIEIMYKNNYKFIIVKFSNKKVIVLDFKNVIEQNNILSTNFSYPQTELFNILK